MPAIQFKHPSPTNEDGIKAPSTEPMLPIHRVQKPIYPPLPQIRKNRFNIQIEWVRHSKLTCSAYLLIGILLTTYYSACFMTQYGTIDKIYEIKPNLALSEPVLTRVIMIQWLFLAASLLFGMSIYRRIFMPLYIFLAVMATNGTLILFVVKVKQYMEGKIRHDDLSLNLVGILLFTATAHNLVYLYAMHVHLNSRAYKRASRPVQQPIKEVSLSKEEKKDLSVVV
ncbi:DUF4149 domain-containing protein [Caenorhabditis elegans]|uniref:DUF4149 domain-containing protein n=1 Tax=Caenorhabditis elegans TaxID=6239 RepID=Q22646_CAEEL|nr:DUF4149 domain-containing protein [Caenorhabditis elegans]CAA97338.1 DUF4149 domain-containing protein [Caenorhabditis elegans]|eukprot:NP_505720.1 Uncharacterized protein CELE_T21C9.11 [Caenorhabditis elegans]